MKNNSDKLLFGLVDNDKKKKKQRTVTNHASEKAVERDKNLTFKIRKNSNLLVLERKTNTYRNRSLYHR